MAKHDIEMIKGAAPCIGQINAPMIGIDLSIAKIKSNTKETHLYKDSNEHLELSSNDESSFTIEDYTYPIDFKLCS